MSVTAWKQSDEMRHHPHLDCLILLESIVFMQMLSGVPDILPLNLHIIYIHLLDSLKALSLSIKGLLGWFCFEIHIFWDWVVWSCYMTWFEHVSLLAAGYACLKISKTLLWLHVLKMWPCEETCIYHCFSAWNCCQVGNSSWTSKMLKTFGL